MSTSIPTATKLGRNHAFDSVCEAMRDVSDEASLWHLAETIGPLSDAELVDAVDEAKARDIATKSANTLRLYRDVAKRFPKSKRVIGVSFSAHREALGGFKGQPDAADKASATLTELVRKHGAANVTITTVRQALQGPTGANGSTSTAKPRAGSKAAASVAVDSLVDDLVSRDGRDATKAIDSAVTTNVATYDDLIPALRHVLARAEAAQSKLARQAQVAAAKVKAAARPVTPSGPVKRTGKATGKATGKVPTPARPAAARSGAGDLRDL